MPLANAQELVPNENDRWFKTFFYHGVELALFSEPYNNAGLNERAVEIPVIRHCLKRYGSILELGNVLGHYKDAPERVVIDPWEEAEGVINQDVFAIAGPWDQIVSISAVEHVRWDEEPREDGGSIEAIEHLRSLLNPGGQLTVTFPTGYNPPLDEWAASGATGATRACTLVRDMDGWRQTPEIEIRPYALMQPWAEAVWIGEFGG